MRRARTSRPDERRFLSSGASAQRLLGQDREAVAARLRDDAEPGDANLGGLSPPVAHFKLGEHVLDGLGIELDDDPLTDVDPRLLEQGHVRGLPPPTLPEKVEPVVSLPRAVSLRRDVLREA